MHYPIDLTFKILALANQIFVHDANGASIGYVRQKMFRLKEDINVYADDRQQLLLYNIKADRVIDFSARYHFLDAGGKPVGSIKRRGMRSILKAHYEIFDENNDQIMEIKEENALIKVLDSLVGGIPVLGAFSGYFINPAYIISRPDGNIIGKIQKQPAFFEGKFRLEKIGVLNEREETVVLLSSMMMALLERMRG